MPEHTAASATPDLSRERWEYLRARVHASPNLPGIYRWLDREGEVLYVGKAKDLRKRLSSYVRPSSLQENFRRRGLKEYMADLDITVTDTELEALVLELHLIRSLKPRYNVLLTRDEHVVYVRISVQEDFPRVELTPDKAHDGAEYFGPFTNIWHQRQMLHILRRLYPFRTCGMSMEIDRRQQLFGGEEAEETPKPFPLPLIVQRRDRRIPCLDYHIERCSGPCTGMVDPQLYRRQCIDSVLAFYHGDTSAVMNQLVEKMQQSSIERKFERAAELSTTLMFLEQLSVQRAFFDPSGLSADAVGMAQGRNDRHIVLLRLRGGKIVDEESIRCDPEEQRNHAITQFLVQVYDQRAEVPPLLLLSQTYSDHAILQSWVASTFRTPLGIEHPKRGLKARLLSLAERNAHQKLALDTTTRSRDGLRGIPGHA